MLHLRMWNPLFLFPFACGLFLFAAGQGPSAQQPKNQQTIKVEVEMVSLPVVVYSRDGRYVAGLRKEDFQVIEDGMRQEISGFAATREPISVALLLDSSGSTERNLKRIQDEAVRFVNLLRPDDASAIISFADEVHLLEPFNIERMKNTAGIRDMRPGGLTAVYEAVWLALEQVLEHEYGRKALVLFSDGVDNHSDSVSKEETLELARHSKATIYSIYFEADKPWSPRVPGGRFEFLQGLPRPGGIPPIGRLPGARRPYPELIAGREYLDRLAEESGGFLVDANRLDNLGSAFRRIALELANQYSIGYYSTNKKHDGQYRAVEVRLNRPGLVARTKRGYYAPKETRPRGPRG